MINIYLPPDLLQNLFCPGGGREKRGAISRGLKECVIESSTYLMDDVLCDVVPSARRASNVNEKQSVTSHDSLLESIS